MLCLFLNYQFCNITFNLNDKLDDQSIGWPIKKNKTFKKISSGVCTVISKWFMLFTRCGKQNHHMNFKYMNILKCLLSRRIGLDKPFQFMGCLY